MEKSYTKGMHQYRIIDTHLVIKLYPLQSELGQQKIDYLGSIHNVTLTGYVSVSFDNHVMMSVLV